MRSLERASGARGRAAAHAAHAAVRPDRARSRATSRATCPACGRTARSTPTPRSGRCSPPRCRGDGDRAFELFQMINPLHPRRTPDERGDLQGRALRRRGRRLHRRRASWAAAGGPGTPARRAGCTAWGWRRSSASPGGATASGWTPGCRGRGRSSALEYRYGSAVYDVVVERPHAARGGAQEVVLDGRTLDGEWIELADDGARHTVVVRPHGVGTHSEVVC